MKTLKIVLLTITLCFIGNIKAQKFNPKTIPLSENPTNSELQFLKEELKDTQVVLLGENTHFDGNIFEYRNKILEFLFKEMGFTTIAFESGIYDVYKAKKEISSGENIGYAFQNSLMGAWGYSKEPMQIVNFYKNFKPNIFGFDSQFTNNYGFKNFSKDLYGYLKQQKIDFPFNNSDFDLLLESLNESFTFDEEDISFLRFENYFKRVLTQIDRLPKTEENFYWYKIIESFLSNAKDIYVTKEFWTPFSISTKDNMRDKQMARNLLAYIKKHPKEKIVCWSANVHFITNMQSVNVDKLQNVLPMGTYLKKELGNKLYSLASVTATDELKFGGKVYKTPIDSLSFEYFMLQKKYPISFVKANQKILEKPIKNRIFSNDKFIESKLNSLFEGYLFFKNYRLSTRIKNFKSNKKEENRAITLKGKVIDGKTKEPLEMAEVTIPKLLKSVITDKNGNYEITLPLKEKKAELYINYLGYESKKVVYGKHKLITLKEVENVLDEVVIKSNKQALRTLKDVIKKIELNYQMTPFNLKRYTTTNYKVKDSSFLQFELITNEYDRGFNSGLRPAYKAEQIKWIKSNDNRHPKNVRELMQGYGFYQAIFNRKKLKKFSLQFESDTIINNQKTTVISFSTPRNQFIYTGQLYKCNYKGKLFINQKDKAIVRFEQYWDVLNSTPSDFIFGWYLPFKADEKTYKMKKETKTVTYRKHTNNRYYVSTIESYSEGNVHKKKEQKAIEIYRNLKSVFFGFDYKGTNFIEHSKNNSNSFKGIKYDMNFWNSFRINNIQKK